METTPNQIGSLVFCSRCGNLLDLPGDEDQLTCDGCGQVEDASSTSFTPSTLMKGRELIMREQLMRGKLLLLKVIRLPFLRV